MCVCVRYLDVVVGVPVGVVDDDGVCGCQVDSQTARTRGQQEAELLSARRCGGVCVHGLHTHTHTHTYTYTD